MEGKTTSTSGRDTDTRQPRECEPGHCRHDVGSQPVLPARPVHPLAEAGPDTGVPQTLLQSLSCHPSPAGKGPS